MNKNTLTFNGTVAPKMEVVNSMFELITEAVDNPTNNAFSVVWLYKQNTRALLGEIAGKRKMPHTKAIADGMNHLQKQGIVYLVNTSNEMHVHYKLTDKGVDMYREWSKPKEQQVKEQLQADQKFILGME
jgi:DNA-binding HxlR family transcriptional regulator